jgi:hypothetical protein
MNFVVIGTDHRMQHSESGFEGLLRAWLNKQFIEPLIAIAEEYHQPVGDSSIAQKLAKEYQLQWFNVEMTTEEKQTAGILQEQLNRPRMFEEAVSCRLPSDDVREEAWAAKLTTGSSGTILVICGYLHFEALVKKLKVAGHNVDKRVYLETVPVIKPAEAKIDC